jgi:hypothetical protein
MTDARMCEQGGDVIIPASVLDGMLRLYTGTPRLEKHAYLRPAPPTAGSRSRSPAPKQRSRSAPAGPGVTPETWTSTRKRAASVNACGRSSGPRPWGTRGWSSRTVTCAREWASDE